MQFIKVGEQYVNMAQVQHIEMDRHLGINTLHLHTSDHLIRIHDEDEQAAVLAWLSRNSINVLKQRDL